MPNELDRQPTGTVSNAWYVRGYQAAMRDIADAYQRGGDEAVQTWVADNTMTAAQLGLEAWRSWRRT